MPNDPHSRTCRKRVIRKRIMAKKLIGISEEELSARESTATRVSSKAGNVSVYYYRNNFSVLSFLHQIHFAITNIVIRSLSMN